MSGDVRQLLSVIRYDTRVTYTLVALIIGANAWTIIPEMINYDTGFDDLYHGIIPFLAQCDPLGIPSDSGAPTRNALSWWLICVSYDATGYYKIIPLIFNIAIMPLVYLLGSFMTNNRLIGLIALIAFTYQPLYTNWEGNGIYSQIWAFFLLLSFVLLFKNKGILSNVSFVASALAKVMTIAYLPVWFYVALKQKQGIGVVTMSGIIVVSIIVISQVTVFETVIGNEIGFYPENAIDVVTRNFSIFYKTLPVLGVFFAIDRIIPGGIKNKDVCYAFIIWSFALTGVIHVFTEQLTFPYRYVPLAAFISIFYAMVLQQTGEFIVKRKLALSFKNT